jgi:poly(ADP-ribose) glycohydrolase ARH3
MAMPEQEDTLRRRERFAGALLGTMVGDALGAPIEGADAGWVNKTLDSLPELAPHERELAVAVYGMVTGHEVERGSAFYTDDTQMMIGVAESLIEHPAFDGAHMASRFAENFQVHRGYGPGAHALLLELRKGEPWDDVAGRLFGGQGSFGNGGAMRVAPVGALYHDNPARLRRVAEAQAHITHAHVLGAQGAVWQAAAVAAALRFDPENTDFDPAAFLDSVLETVGPLEPWYADAARDIRNLLDTCPPAAEVADVLGNGIEAHLSVPAALYAFLAHWDSFAEAVLFAVRMGGDTDTIGAMTGAIAGALHGEDAIPPNWLTAVENGVQGRDYVRELSVVLYETWRVRAADTPITPR